jgi:hypothetical protein
VAIGLRAVGHGLPPEGSPLAEDPYSRRQFAYPKALRASLVKGIQTAMREATRVLAILRWWRRSGLSPKECCSSP